MRKGEYPKVKFIFNAKKEMEYIDLFVNDFREDFFLPKKILKLFNEDKDKLISILKKSYGTKIKEKYERGWRKIEKDYFRLIEEITEYKWLHKRYNVVLTRYFHGACNPFKPKTNEVAVQQNIRKSERNYIIAHELFHSHYHQIVSKKHKSKLFFTELNENCAILTLLFTKARKIFPEISKQEIKSCIKSNLKATKWFKKLSIIWKKRKNFDDYLDKSLKLLEKIK